jgi:hypothetical protein
MTSPRHRIANRQLGAWHRRLGLAAATVLVLLIVSGLLLNHGHRLGLDRIYVQSAWLLDWYGIRPPGEPRGVALGAHWLSELDGRIYFDARELPGVRGELHGAVLFGGDIAVAVGEDVWLLTPAGDVVERLGEAHDAPVRTRRERPVALPAALRAELVRQYRGRGLSVERLLLDLHAGRILGEFGAWLVDLTAIACLGLAVTGLWLWSRRR